MKRPCFLAAAFAVILCPGLAISQTEGGQAESQPIRQSDLTADDLRLIAQELLGAGDAAGAAAAAAALLARDPADLTALIIGAQAALETGRPAEAAILARRGFAAADDDIARYVAARLAARAHAEQSQFSRSQIWLRLARQNAPDAESAAAVAEDYALVRDANPLSLSLTFGISPSSNINNGSRSDTVELFGLELTLSEAAKALSGIQYEAGGTARYRLNATDRSATFAEVDLRSTTFTLSQASRNALQRDIDAALSRGLPTDDLPRTGRDFASTTLSFGLIHNRILSPGARPTAFTLRAGKTWYDGDPFQTFVDLGVSHSYSIGDRAQLRLDAGLQKQFAEDAVQDTLTYSFNVGYSQLLANGDIVSVTVTDRINTSDDSERDNTTVRIGVGYDLARPIGDVRFGFGAAVEQRGFESSIYTDGGRIDRTATAQITAVFDQIEYYGFIPVVTLSGGRTFSDAARFDTDFGTIGFDLRSSF